MAKKTTSSAPSKAPARKATGSTAAAVADVPANGDAVTLNLSIPADPARGADQAVAQAVAPKRAVTHQMIAERAYELYTQGAPGTPDDHWIRAEQELRG